LTKRLSALLFLLLIPFAACRREKSAGGSDYESRDTQGSGYTFIVYPGARLLPELTDLRRKAQSALSNGSAPPPQAVYDTEASLEEVAAFYAKQYGYGKVAPDATGNFSSASPPAYYRGGDLAQDNAGMKPVLDKIGFKADLSKAVGTYKGAQISAQPSRPAVTLTRPYFDISKSQVVNRTLIIMYRE
jgi:hypothetical protein